jgi:hypothetical protein
MAQRPVRLMTSEDSEALVAHCPRPACRKEVRQIVGRGRPKTYCSEECRRLAEAELRRLDLRLRHYSSVVEQVRIDIASYQRSGADRDGADPRGELRLAEDALARAESALEFLEGDESPTVRALRRLCETVQPVVRGPAREAG